MRKPFKSRFLLSAALVALAPAAPAFAQEAPAEEEAVEESEIIVTAAKREQTLQDVAISVSVTSAQTIEQSSINDLIDLQFLVPSLKIPQFQSSSETNFVIRGFGNGSGNIGIESSVGVFVDGVYRSKSASAIADLPEIERIEVLRGPQSTLFGKNTSAGAISIITKKPTFDWSGNASLTFGNYDAREGTLSLNAGLSDTTALRISGSFNKRDGTFNNINLGTKVNNRDRFSLRYDMIWEPSADVSFRLIGDYNKLDEICCGAVPIFNGPVTVGVIGAPPPNGLGAVIGNTSRVYNYETVYSEDPTNRLVGKGISLQGDFDLGFAKLTSITSARGQSDATTLDVDFTAAKIVDQAIDTQINNITQEFRLTSDGDGPFSWLVGAFYGTENIERNEFIKWGVQGRGFINGITGGLIPLLEGLQTATGGIAPGTTYIQPGQGVNVDYSLKSKSYSLFGQADYKIGEKFTVSGGLAYLNDSKRGSMNGNSTDAFARLNLENVPNIGFVPFTNLPAGVQACLAQKGFNPATTGGRVPANLFGNTLGASLPNAGSAPCPVSLPGTNPFALTGAQFLAQPFNYTDERLKADKVVYMARLAYDFSRRLNAYVSYSKGWKAGAFNLSRDSRPQLNGVGRSTDPENVTVYELGIKGSFQGGFANLAVFKQSIKGFQSNAFTGTGFNLVNAGEQSVKGFEFDFGYRPFKGMNLGGGVTYLDPLYDSFTRARCIPADPRCTPGVQFRDISGTKPEGISKWSVNLNAAYNFELGSDWDGYLRAEYSYASTIRNNIEITPAIPVGFSDYNNVNMSLGIGNKKIVEAQFWVRNLTKDEALISAFPSVAQAGSFAGYPIQPRTYGITLRKSF
jgi:iron complex outermembrane recepter protein